MNDPNFRWNFSVNVLDISFYNLAVNMVSQATILPLLVSQLTGSKLAVGLLPVISSLGFLLPQLLTAGYSEGLRRKKPFLMFYSALGERLPLLLTGLFVGFFSNSAPAVALGAIYLGLAISSSTSGVLTPAWFDMIAKVIPLQWRGVWFGLGNGLGAFMGIAGAAIAGRLLAAWAFPQNYAMCFLLAFLFNCVSWTGLALNREPDSPTVKTHASFTGYLRQLPNVLRRDRNYQIFLISRSVTNLGGMAAGFFIVYGAERFGLSGAQVGALTAVFVGSQALAPILGGWLATWLGYSPMFAATLAAAVAGSMMLGIFVQEPRQLAR